MELLKVWTALLRRKWLFIQAVIFFTVGAGVLAMVLPKRFEATSKISVSASQASMSILGDLDLSEMAQSLTNADDDITTMISLAQMRPVLDEVIWRLQLRDLNGKLLPSEKLLVPGIDGEMLAMPFIEIAQAQGTNILLVTGTASSPELSALLADTMVEVYLAKSTADARSDTKEALGFVSNQLQVLKGQYDEDLKKLAEAQQRLGVIEMDTEAKAAVSRVNDIWSSIAQAQAEVAETDAQIRQLGVDNKKESTSMVAPGTVATNTQVKDLRQKLTDLRIQRQQQLLDKTEQHPDIVAVDSQINKTSDELERALTEEHTLDPAVQSLYVKRQGLKQRLGELTSTMKTQISEGGALPEKARDLAQLQLSAAATQSVYQSLLEQQYQIAVAEAMTVSDMKMVEPAKQPDKAAAPKLLVYLVLGGFVGVCVGVGLVFLAEYIDDSIRSKEDLKIAWPVSLMGMIPTYKLKGNHRFIENLPATDPLFEAYRGVRSSIAFAGVDSPITILTVTSSAPGEGKSTFCTNLGICLSSDGQKVVIVDCDLRRPTQHRAFPTLSNQRGVSSVLTGACTLAEAIQETPVPNLHVLTSGPLPANPGRLVESLRLRSLMSELARSYDMVIVDAPPLLAVSDALALSRASRATLLVVEYGKTTRRMLTDVKATMEGGGVEPIGVVLNKVDPRSGGYGNYQKYAKMYARRPKDVPVAKPADIPRIGKGSSS